MRRAWRPRAVAAVLVAAAALAVYLPATRHGFILTDDAQYITANPHVSTGLGWKNLRWALGTTEALNWHPLTWVSHQLDVEIFGIDPGRHHLVGMIIHAAGAVLLFLALSGLTAAPWPSLFAAALFAVHPLHVESVAWAAERKDVLSGLFFMLTLLAWLSWIRRPGVGRYLAALLLFTLGLAAKPMLVTLPFVLLLLDWWPLGRFGAAAPPARSPGFPRLLGEKIPFLILAAASSAMTLLAQSRGGAVIPMSVYPIGLRAANALVSCVAYLRKAAWPVDLVLYYPHPDAIPWRQTAGAAALLLLITALALGPLRRRAPFLTVGWLWYLGMLVPVIGLVQVGDQGMADRYTYLPLVGVFVMAAWGAPALVTAGGVRRCGSGLAALGFAAVVLLAGAARTQVGYWKDSLTLFQHSLEVNPDSWPAHNDVGVLLLEQGRVDEAVGHFREVIRLRSHHADAYNNLGVAFSKQGRLEDAVAQYRKAVQLRRDYPEAHFNLGAGLAALGRDEEAAGSLGQALLLRPGYAKAWLELGRVHARLRRWAEAVRCFEAALRADPGLVPARVGLAMARRGEAEGP